jgi:hypothetical protein
MVVPVDDALTARRRQQATRRLEEAAGDMPRPPWLASGQPSQSVDLVRHLLWRSSATGPAPVDDVLSALTLLPAAREELDQIEAGLLFVARSSGLSWAQIADAVGLHSRQAAQQRFGRVLDRRPDGGS